MDDKNKVGRPKLANNALKKESFLMLMMCFIMVIMLSSIGVNNISFTSLNGSLKADGTCVVKSYKINSATVKVIMNCDNNVKSAKLYNTSLKKTDNGLVGYKYLSLDTNKKINYSWVSKSGTYNKTYKIYNK